MAYQLLIFDLDGTLIDSKDDVVFSVNETLAKYDLALLPEERIHSFMGIGMQPLLREAVGHRPEINVENVLASFQEFYLKNSLVRTKVYPGMLDVLHHYHDRKKVILTSKSNRPLENILDGLGLRHYFCHAFGRQSFPKLKPDPFPVYEIMKLCDVSPSDCVLIGDTENDLRAAKAAGVKSCAVTFGYGDPEILLKENPDYVAANAEALLGLF